MDQLTEVSSDKTPQTPKWLQRIQENSWEAEILISGGAVFSLFQLADLLVQETEYLKEVTPFIGLDEMLIILMVILRGVTIGFIVHLLLRGFWISLVCLNSAYPNGIQYQKLKITGRYLEQSKRMSLTSQIIRLDQLSGLVFFGSFLFIIIIIGVFSSFIPFIFLSSSFKLSENYVLGSLTIFVLFLTYAYWFDMLSSGILRRNKVIGKFYYSIYSFLNLISLGFLYRHFLQLISTNINKWKAAGFIIFMLSSSLLLSYVSLLGVLHLSNPFDRRDYPATTSENYLADGLYLNRITDEARVRWACIQSDLITDDFVRVFIPFRANYDDGIRDAQKRGFSEIITVSINDSVYNNIEWHGYSRRVSGQSGVVAYLPIVNLKKGKGELAIEIKDEYFQRKKPGMRDGKLVIPFWKQ